jgi:hypothetical protein
MNETQLPTREDIKELTAFLPRLYAEGFRPVQRWEGGTPNLDGSISLPWPVYDEVVEQFFKTAGKTCWLDYNYQPEQAGAMLADENAVRSATLAQIKTMLTFCLRGERFSDGHWADMIEQGHIRRLLERLAELA